MSIKKNQIKSLILIALLGFSPVILYLLQIKKQTKEYKFISFNVADIQTNPIEYRSTLKLLSSEQGTSDPSLCKAAQKLLIIDSDPTTYQCQHETSAIAKSLEEVLLLIQPLEIEEPGAEIKDPKVQIKDFLNIHLIENNNGLHTFEDGHIRFGELDKTLRQLRKTRFSPTFYHHGMMEWLSQNAETFDLESFTEQWIKYMKPHIETLYQKTIESGKSFKNFEKNILLTFLFDLHLTRRIIENKGAQAWITFVQKLEKSPLGDPQQREKVLLNLIKMQDADIICLQECDVAFLQAALQQGYFISTSEGATFPTKEGSFTLYKKSTFKNATINPLTLDKKDIASQKEKTISSKGLKRLISEEVSLHKVYHNDMIWLVANFHATSNGDNTITFLKSLFTLKERIEAKEGKKVLLLLGMDANSSVDYNLIQKNLKMDLEEIHTLLQQQYNKYLLVKQESDDTNTVNKERSSFQIQFKKKHILMKGISDHIMISKIVTQKKNSYILIQNKTYLSPHGPNIKRNKEGNPSDHRAIGLTFILKEVK